MKSQSPPEGAHGAQNGKYEAPHFLNGASSRPHTTRPHPVAPSQPRTVFPPEPNHADWRRFAYIIDQFLFFGAPLRRYAVILLAVLALLALIGFLPGRGWSAALFVGAAVALAWYVRADRKHDFVRFEPTPMPAVIPERLPVEDKVPAHVTGHFSVEGKYKRFAHLPGFYRTFASGEHALLCLIRDRVLYGIGHWPEEDVGMWYIFFMPNLIQRIDWGTLAFGPDRGPAVAVTYLLTIPPGDQNHKERTLEETVYITTETTEEARRILADLLWELPSTARPIYLEKDTVKE